jgi:hypothetical protein
MILVRLIVVIFSAKKILLMNFICWIADRLTERFEIQLRVIVVYSMIEKMGIAVWLIQRTVVLLIEMIAVWLTRKSLSDLMKWESLSDWQFFFVQKLNWSFSNWWFRFSWFESRLSCLSRIIYRVAIKIDFAKMIDDVWFKFLWVIDDFRFDSENRVFFLKNLNQKFCDDHLWIFQNSYVSFSQSVSQTS